MKILTIKNKAASKVPLTLTDKSPGTIKKNFYSKYSKSKYY